MFPWFLAAAGCGPPAPAEVFSSRIVPILEGRCLSSNCHGVLPGAEDRGESIDWDFFFVRVRPDGRVIDGGAAYANVKRRINSTERPEFSSLLRKPLARAAGGVPHAGGVQFGSGGDPAWRALRDWIATESSGGEGQAWSDLPPEVQRFGEQVLPHLAARQCMNAGCHGPFAPFTAFETPVIVGGVPAFSAQAVVRNHAAARMHLHLGGDPTLSRLVRKMLPLDQGGIAHRGGNDIFVAASAGRPATDDAAVRAIIDWAAAERLKVLGGDAPRVEALVFVRGPLGPATATRHDTFVPGTDVFLLAPPEPGGIRRNLTAAAHAGGPADVRDPAVSHDARRVAFATRRSDADAHNIYELGIDGSGWKQLTFDAGVLPGGGRTANVQPTYGPDGRVWFASTRAGHLADRYPGLDTEIWAVDSASGALERWTFDPAPELTPSFIGTGKSYGTLAFSVLRAVGGRRESAVFRGPIDHNRQFHGDPENHIHHGSSLRGGVVYGMRTTPDGRFTASLLGADNVWRAGQPVVFERQFGPEIPPGADASVGGYRRALRVLDAAVAAGGPSAGGAYRHLVPLPDGRILASFAPGPLDLDDPGLAPDFGIAVLRLEEDRVAGGPRLVARSTLVDDRGVGEYDAEPVVRRPPEDDTAHAAAWDRGRTAGSGAFAHRHVEVLEALFASLGAQGAKPLRSDLAFARLVEWMPTTPAEVGAAPLSAGVHGRSRILAEVPLLGGSLLAEVPADRPFRLQFLNRDRMAVGAQHNRWIHVAPDERFPGGASPALYPSLCAGCHGSLSGLPSDARPDIPDVITAASVTPASHHDANPRRPRPPERVGGAPVSVDFRRDVRPLLQRSCVECHGGAAPAGGLDLTPRPTASFDAMYEALLAVGAGSVGGRRYVDEAGSSAWTSHLVERVYGREMGAPKAVTRACPGEPPLTDEERLTVARWIDLGAVYRGVAP